MADAVSPESLLADAAWWKRLALTLAGDTDDADDLVQESWIAAWQRQPDTGRPLRPWPSKVVRVLSKMQRRAGERRAARETAAQRPEHVTPCEGMSVPDDPQDEDDLRLFFS